MTGDEYVDAMNQLSLACRLILNLEDRLDQCLRTVEMGEAIGPILDPTGFSLGGAQNLEHARKILQPAIALRNAARSIEPARFAPPPSP